MPELEKTRPWIASRLAKAPGVWDSIPEHCKPVVNSPYFAHRADDPRGRDRATLPGQAHTGGDR